MHASTPENIATSMDGVPRIAPSNRAEALLPLPSVQDHAAFLVRSVDDGRSFPHCAQIEDGTGACLSNNSTDGQNREMSYPSLIENPDGSLDLAYTYHRRAIKHVRLSPDWLETER